MKKEQLTLNLQLEDAPAEFQADLAAMDQMENDALWTIARAKKALSEFQR